MGGLSSVKRCPVYHWKNGKIILNKLQFLQPLSKNIGDTMIATYLCSGDETHEPHLLRIEDTFSKIANKTSSFTLIPEMKKRLFPRQEDQYKTRMIKGQEKQVLLNEWQLRCPIAQSQMKFQRSITEKIGDPTIDIFRCTGTSWGHHHHFAKIQHGMIPLENGKQFGILVFTRQLHKKRIRNDETRLTKGEFFNLVNKVWKEDTKSYQPSTVLELVKAKLARS
jgi:hypothetical protein